MYKKLKKKNNKINNKWSTEGKRSQSNNSLITKANVKEDWLYFKNPELIQDL